MASKNQIIGFADPVYVPDKEKVPYVYTPYPGYRFKTDETGKLIKLLVNNEEENKKAKADGWFVERADALKALELLPKEPEKKAKK